MILCFSGTGNSLMAANQLSSISGDKIVPLRKPLPSPITVPHGEDVIWIMPCHSWGMPKWVNKTIDTMQIDAGHECRHHLIVTCGDDIGLTHLQWRRKMRRKGWNAVGTYSLTMPNTYVLLPGFDVDSPKVAADKLAAMPQRIKDIWRGIRHGARVDDVHQGSIPWIKTRLIYPLFMRFLTSPRPFHALGGCIGCSACAKACPLGNISMNDKYPSWGNNCTLCLGCYHACPRHAVAYGKITGHKGQKGSNVY